MHKIFNSFKKEKFKAKNKKEDYHFENYKKNDNNYFLNKFTDCKNCIKELKNDLILIGINKYLIKLKLGEKFLDYGISKKFDNIISDINILPNKDIIIITNENMIIINLKFNEYFIKEKYQIKNNWKMRPNVYTGSIQYFSSDIIAINKLLLKIVKFQIQKLFLLT